MSKVIQFHISKGEHQYVAQSIDVPVVTQGKTLDILASNIQEALSLYFEEEPTQEEPTVMIDYQLPSLQYA